MQQFHSLGLLVIQLIDAVEAGPVGGLDFWSRGQAVYSSIQPLAEDLLSAPASQAYYWARFFFVRLAVTAGRRNRASKSLEIRIYFLSLMITSTNSGVGLLWTCGLLWTLWHCTVAAIDDDDDENNNDNFKQWTNENLRLLFIQCYNLAAILLYPYKFTKN